MAKKASSAAQKATVEIAISSIGLGFDLTVDLRLKYCKSIAAGVDSRLIVIDDDCVRDICIPGGVCVPNVPKSIKCDKGERMRFGSDVLSFQQVLFFLLFYLYIFFFFFFILCGI